MKKIVLLTVISLYLAGCAKEYQDKETLCMAWYNQGLENMDNPENDFKKAIEADPKFAPSYYWLASYYCKVGRKEEAIEYFEMYLRVVDKNDPVEKDRIKTAHYFISELQSGNTDYDSIVEKSIDKD